MNFTAIYNSYVALYRSDVSEHSDIGEYVVVLYSIQLCIDNLGGICLDVGSLVFT